MCTGSYIFFKNFVRPSLLVVNSGKVATDLLGAKKYSDRVPRFASTIFPPFALSDYYLISVMANELCVVQSSNDRGC
jgi:hypothetical protein